ncbi:hypothetical protein GCM10023195_14990 [Actinoallomurus liliacearum]|uniref:Uncharacterized protein n=1 Tax=Actinoallomurus liliacearum TaxID=1080073 RepID=A0ABP8TCG0_9ACTN
MREGGHVVLPTPALQIRPFGDRVGPQLADSDINTPQVLMTGDWIGEIGQAAFRPEIRIG